MSDETAIREHEKAITAALDRLTEQTKRIADALETLTSTIDPESGKLPAYIRMRHV